MARLETKSLVEASILAAIAVVLVLAGNFIPVVSMVILFFWPVPILLVHIRHGLRASVLTVVVAGLVLTLFLGPGVALSQVPMFGLAGIAMGIGVSKRYPPFRIITLAVVGGLLALALQFLISYYLLRLNVLAEAVDMFNQSLEQVKRMQPQNAKMVDETLKPAVELMRRYWPALFVLTAITTAFINYAAARLVMGRLKYELEPVPPFARWHISGDYLVVLVVGLALIWLEPYHKLGILSQLGAALSLLMIYLYNIIGVSLAYHYLRRFGLSKAMAVILLVWLVPTLGGFAALAGMYDSVADPRGILSGDVEPQLQ